MFIDEAYQLNPYTSNHPDIYKQDCINELIQQMENNRDRLIVIFAGYADEMAEFVKKANPGMESRIGQTVFFPDYSAEELMKIFHQLLAKRHFTINPAAEKRVYTHIVSEKALNENFGNARFVRSYFEKILMRHAHNTREFPANSPELFVITEEDIV